MYGFPRAPRPLTDLRGKRTYNGLPESENLALWLKADTSAYSDSAGTTAANVNDVVNYWKDQSGNSRHFLSYNTAVPTLRSDSGGKYLDTSTGYLYGKEQRPAHLLALKAPFHAAIQFAHDNAQRGLHCGGLDRRSHLQPAFNACPIFAGLSINGGVVRIYQHHMRADGKHLGKQEAHQVALAAPGRAD